MLLFLTLTGFPLQSAEPKPGFNNPPGENDLAAPETLPPELRTLRLTKTQAEKINAWRKSQTTPPNPTKYAQFIESILTAEQREAFHKILQTGGG